MKKLLSLVLTLILIMSALPFSAAALTEGDWEYTIQDNEIIITGYNGAGGDIVIPETIRGLPVVQVKEDGEYLHKATSIVFPSTIKKIETLINNGLSTNTTLESVVIPEGIEEIGYRAFVNCTKLTSVTLPSTLKIIGMQAFNGCTSLAYVNIHSGIESFGHHAFAYTALTKVDLTGVNAELATSMFFSCPALRRITLNPGTTEIPERFAANCTALEDVVLPDTIKIIDVNAFSKCAALTEIIFPISLREIHDYAFSGTGFTEVIIPYGTELVNGLWPAFGNCPNLESIYVPSSVTTVYSNLVAGSPNAIIYCASGSEMEQVANEDDAPYIIDNSVDSTVNVLYNGRRISFHNYGQNPAIVDSRTLVPLRSIFETMGATVSWDGGTRTVTSERGGVEISITIGESVMYVNGEAREIPTPAAIINDRAMVPARAIAEAFNATVGWNAPGYTVIITE